MCSTLCVKCGQFRMPLTTYYYIKCDYFVHPWAVFSAVGDTVKCDLAKSSAKETHSEQIICIRSDAFGHVSELLVSCMCATTAAFYCRIHCLSNESVDMFNSIVYYDKRLEYVCVEWVSISFFDVVFGFIVVVIVIENIAYHSNSPLAGRDSLQVWIHLSKSMCFSCGWL